MSLSRDDRLEQAARWLVRSQDKDFTPENQKMLTVWLKEDPANREAFEEMGGIWEHVGVLEHVFAFDEKYENPEVFVHHREAERFTGLNALFSRLFKANKKVAIAGVAMAMLVLLCLPAFKMYFFEQAETFYAYTTAAGEQKTVTLGDGSILEMNVSSSLAVRMNKRYRQVEMSEGEVFFEVKPDPNRSFEVRAANGLVRVLGTAFNVKSRRGQVTVDVEYGRVQVRDDPKGPGDMRIKGTTLMSGQGVDINSSGRLSEVRASDIKQVLAWQKQQVVFRNTPVGEVLHELELYHNVKIKMAFGELEEKGITGTFDMRNLKQTLGVIVTAASLKIDKEADGTITLYKKSVVNDR